MKLFCKRVHVFESDKAIDIYAYAMTLYNMIVGVPPWSIEKLQIEETKTLVTQGKMTNCV